MARNSGNHGRGKGNVGTTKGGNQGSQSGHRGYGPPGGWPSTTGKPSGRGRGNAPPSKQR